MGRRGCRLGPRALSLRRAPRPGVDSRHHPPCPRQPPPPRGERPTAHDLLPPRAGGGGRGGLVEAGPAAPPGGAGVRRGGPRAPRAPLVRGPRGGNNRRNGALALAALEATGVGRDEALGAL